MGRLLTAICLTIVSGGAAMASPAMTTRPTAMRDAPNPHARIVQSIPPNAEIDIEGCGRIWCSASWRDISGFVAASSVAPADGEPLVYRDAPPPVGPYLGPPVLVAPFGFGFGYGWHRHYY